MSKFTRTFPKYECVQPSNKSNLSFRPFLISDEKALLLIKEEKNTSLIVKNIVNVLVSCFDNLDVNTMTLQDVEYLFCILRSKSVGEMVKVNFTCPTTNEKITSAIDLSTIVPNSGAKTYELKLDENYKIVFQEPSITKIISIKGNYDTDHLIKASICKVFKDDSVFEDSSLSEEDLEEIMRNLTTKEHLELKKFILNLPKSCVDVSYKTSDEVDRKMRMDGVLNFFTYA